jgi:cytochrome c1
MYKFIILLTILVFPPGVLATEVEDELPYAKLDLSPEAVERGKSIYMVSCRVCHSLNYWRTKENPEGINAFVAPEQALESFGIVPPDLTLITKARGRRLNGAQYVYQFMTTFYVEDGTVKNRAFAHWTETDGTTSMPPAFAPNDPESESKAKDIAAFLNYVADPSAAERKRLGRYVLVYMVILTGLLYLVNRKISLKDVRATNS